VHTLLIKRGQTHPGGACPACGRLCSDQGECPTCQAALLPVEDIVNLALARALDSGAALEQVPGRSALDEMEGLAAVLRYS
jgi:peptide chain release factor subunit 1